MASEVKMDDKSIFSDVSNTIKKALIKVHTANQDKIRLSKTAFEIALEQLI